MDIVTTDFETLYDKEYSLSKMTTEAYIRDPRFEIIGVGVKVNDHPTDWYSGESPGKFLKSLDYSKRAILAHNCAFDGAILAWKFGIRPKLWLDTLSMARPLHGHVVSNSLKSLAEHYGLGVKGDEVIRALGKRRLDFTPQELAQYGAYCINDVDLTYQLFLRLARGFPKDELRLIDLTLRMYTDPLIEIDTDLLTSHLRAVRERKQRLLTEFGGDDALGTIMSNPKFAEHLRSLGVEPPMKTSVRTGKETYAFSKTDQDFLALQEHPDERVAVAVATRLGAKSTIEETRTEALLGVAERGRLPIMLNYCGAHTGRFSGCLVADTKVLVFDHTQGVVEKRIVDVLLDDLVWDGEVFVPHEGVVFSGFAEVIEWDGVIGTEDHVVFTDAGEISLREAMQGAHRIQDARGPSQDDVMNRQQKQAAPALNVCGLREGSLMPTLSNVENTLVAVYDIKNCGPRHRFSANGKLVHNSGGLNAQNLPRGGALRRSLRAPRGCVLIACDSSQIEARLVAWLAGQDDLVESFREGRDVYCEFASTIYGREITKADKNERFVGKTCLSASTRVLTNAGWKRIVDVVETDLLWDGVEWVSHGGVCYMGVKQTIRLSGVELTPDHEILVDGTKWVPARYAQKSDTVFLSALRSATLPSLGMSSTLLRTVDCGDGRPSVDAHGAGLNTHTWLVTCGQEGHRHATHALSGKRLKSGGGHTKLPWPTTCIVQDFSTDSALLSPDATTRKVGTTSTTESAGLLYGRDGGKTILASLSISRRCPDGMTPRGRLTGWITTGATNRATLDSLPEARTLRTNAKSQIWKPVFDILNSGSRNRFTILTDDGPIIVHNCVLGMGYGVGAEKFRKTLALGQGGVVIDLEPNEAKRVVNLYRQTYFKIPELWNLCGYALRAMVAGESGHISILPYTPEGIQLPNGFVLRYPALRMTENGFAYINDPRSYKAYLEGNEGKVLWNNIYGGKTVENLVQALARIVITEQMLQIAKRYKIVLQVHDEVVVICPESHKDKAIADITKIMSTPPAWAPDLPVACEAGWGYSYGDSK